MLHESLFVSVNWVQFVMSRLTLFLCDFSSYPGIKPTVKMPRDLFIGDAIWKSAESLFVELIANLSPITKPCRARMGKSPKGKEGEGEC